MKFFAYKLLLLPFLVFPIFLLAANPIDAQSKSNDSQLVYVCLFVSYDSTVTGSTWLITEEFETALTQSKCFRVLERDNIDRLIAQIIRERKIIRMIDLETTPISVLDTLKALHATAVVFGEVIDDYQSGEIKVIVSVQSFNGSKKKWSELIPRGRIRDGRTREESMKNLVAQMCTENIEILPPSGNNMETPPAYRSGGLRSLVPGLGQFHKQQYKKGRVFIGLESALFIIAYASLDYSNSAHDKALNASTQRERDHFNYISTNYGRLSNISWILLGMTHVVNMLDGFSSTKISTPLKSNSVQRASYSFMRSEDTLLLTLHLNL